MANRTVATRESVERAIKLLQGEGRNVTVSAIMGVIGGSKPKISAILSDIMLEEARGQEAPQPDEASPAVDPSEGTPAELPEAIRTHADALMTALADSLTTTIRRERERARRELDAEREVHLKAIANEKATFDARVKKLQGEIGTLEKLREQMRDGLNDAGAEEERLQDALEEITQARNAANTERDGLAAECDRLAAELATATARIGEVEKDALSIQAVAGELRGRCDQLEEDLKAARADAKEATEDAKQARERAAVAAADAIRLETERNTAQTERDAARGELEAARAELAKVRAELETVSVAKAGTGNGPTVAKAGGEKPRKGNVRSARVPVADDVRRRILEMSAQGMTRDTIALDLELPRNTVGETIRRARKSASGGAATTIDVVDDHPPLPFGTPVSDNRASIGTSDTPAEG